MKITNNAVTALETESSKLLDTFLDLYKRGMLGKTERAVFFQDGAKEIPDGYYAVVTVELRPFTSRLE